jgi:SpoVK/Ycf46/Vps4 family AAA+-type ATPase
LNNPTHHAAPPHRAGPELKNKYWGQDEENIRELFEVAPNPNEDGDFDECGDEHGE